MISSEENYEPFINHKYFYGAKYTKYTVREIITDFLKKAQNRLLSKRFNMYISNEHEDYLEMKSKDENLNKSAYLRKLLDEDMRITNAQ
ncbi:MAG: hypothetical protein Q9M91_00220 [Candidatus Dojkabacteria bacterium]|nr:hypothetical protein [Candidatus Dojkabacteria bacterium]MDQ7020257.1 hypothetical protein [Candidatus Dojkabacteria bacterium]